jgi:hypothetical protein
VVPNPLLEGRIVISTYFSTLFFSLNTPPWWRGILTRLASAFGSESQRIASPEDIHHRLKEINSRLWRELRTGVLARCHVGLYRVQHTESGENLDWREVNRRTVSAIHRFETFDKEMDQRACLEEVLACLSQKLLIVRLAAIRKADRIEREEEKAIQEFKKELYRISLMLENKTS